jgi:hypothetical protein
MVGYRELTLGAVAELCRPKMGLRKVQTRLRMRRPHRP